MPSPVQLTGLQGFVNSAPEDTPFQVQGNPANPAHANAYWEEKEVYPWESGIDGLDASAKPLDIYTESIGEIPNATPAGMLGQDPTGDQTPYKTHAAPTPKGLLLNKAVGPNHLPEGNAAYLEQSASI